jgi:tetratricopeptide (TPR) repeat protein
LDRRSISNKIKAGFIACFFLLATEGMSADNLWRFDEELARIHLLVLNLQTDQAYAALAKIKTNEYHKIYVQSLCETLDALISEDEKRFEVIEGKFRSRFKALEGKPESAETLFLQAELNLQRGFNFLNLGQEFNAVWAIRSAYNFTQDCLKKYPTFIPIKKTSGVIEVMIGSVPDKYHWFMSLLGMKGSVTTGQHQLEELRVSHSSLSIEASILYYTIKGFINQQFEESAKGFMELLKANPENRLMLFLSVNMLVKNSQSEEALRLIHLLDENPQGLAMPYIDYLRGEILLQRGEYNQSIDAFQRFLAAYANENFKKDAYFKISLAYYLQGKKELANANFEKAKVTGRVVVDPDSYADAQLKDNRFPNPKLLRVRFYTDGGYFKEAKEVFQTIVPSDLTTPKDQTEYYYRKARLSHKMNELSAAKIFYQQTIDMSGQNPWYFAPNSALQLGYLAQANHDNSTARKYFQQALSYKKHEYKNSIDSKAKSAIEQLKK